MPARYGGYRGNKIPGADQNQYRCLAVKAVGRKHRKQITWSSRLGVMRRGSYPSMENISKLKNLKEGTEQDGLMDVDEKNEELDKLIKHGNIVNHIKVQRLS